MKIKANEFRIGNLIDTPYGILPIYGISKNCIEVEYNSEDVSIYDFNLDECKPIPITEEWLLKFGFIANGISYKLENNKLGRFFTDMKAGTYEDGEAIHWKYSEIMQGYRNANIPDFNGHIGPKKLKDAISQIEKDKKKSNILLKIDMVAPYFGKYLEVTMVYFIDSNEGPLNYNLHKIETIRQTLKKDTYKQYLKHLAKLHNHKCF